MVEEVVKSCQRCAFWRAKKRIFFSKVLPHLHSSLSETCEKTWLLDHWLSGNIKDGSILKYNHVLEAMCARCRMVVADPVKAILQNTQWI